MSKKKKINKKHKVNGSADLQQELFNFITTKPDRGVSLKTILNWANRTDDGGGVFDALEILVSKQRIEEYEQDKFRIKEQSRNTDALVGIVDMTQSGNAYVIIDGKLNDVFVPQRKTNRAFNGDTVRVKIIATNKKNKPEGEILEILKRERDTFIGIVDISDRYAFVVTDKKFNNYDFYLSEDEIKRAGVVHGDRVIVRLKDWPTTMKNPIGQIMGKLGKVGEHESDMQSIMVETGVPLHFPAEVEKAASKIPIEITTDEIKKRKDFRNIFTITIDPYDAKDFDDAISYRILDNGNYEIGIHIADVSHYVTPNGDIDKEAYTRGTSVYLVDRVIPMLPEVLSNNVCSLRPQEEKLCFSAVFEMDKDANIVDEWFGKTIIFSDRRFTYEEVQEILENKAGDFATELLELNRIAFLLRDQKFKNGAISFETQEVKFILDEKFVPVGLYVKERKEAHMLIEDFMLLANKKVATYIGKQKNLPFVYRVHDVPDIDRLKEFGLMARRFGYKLNLDSPKNVSAELNKLMVEIKDKPEKNILENMAIRCMAKAVYTTNNIGHYGLAFDYYTHFTSPIRRYPDLLVHRLLFEYLNQHYNSIKKDDLEDKCRHSSAQERKAMEAERESIKYKQVEYLSKHIGEDFDGVISGIMPYGIFVEIIENKCEGMIRTEFIHDEFTYDESRRRLVSLTRGKNYDMGDKVRVKVKKADISTRQIDLELI